MNLNPQLQIYLNKAQELLKKFSAIVSYKSIGYSFGLGFGIATLFSLSASVVLFSLNQDSDKNKKRISDNTKLDQQISLSESDVKIVLDRNIFNQSGELGDDGQPKVVEEEVKVITDEIIKSGLPLKLWGTIYGGDPYTGIAMVENTRRKGTNSFMVGDRVIDNVVLRQILKEKIIFENKGQLEYIDLEKKELVRKRGAKKETTPPPSGLATPQAPVAMSGGRLKNFKEEGYEFENGRIKMTSEYKQNLITKDFSKVLQDAKAEPNMVDGQLQGFKLTRIRTPSIYEKAGLADGDIVTEINGVELSSASQAIRTLQSVRSANQIEITVIQNGVKNTIEIAIGQ